MIFGVKVLVIPLVWVLTLLILMTEGFGFVPFGRIY